MRSAVALAGSVLLAVLLTGCDADVSGSPTTASTVTVVVVTPTTMTPPTPSTVSARPPVSAVSTDPAALRALAGNWRGQNNAAVFEAVVDGENATLSIAKIGYESNTGHVVPLGGNHYRIDVLTSHDGTTPQMAADLGADGMTMTLRMSTEPEPVLMRRIG